MNLPVEIKDKIESKTNNIPLKELKEISQKLSNDYLSKTSSGQNFLTSNKVALSYAITRMPATFGALTFALEHSLSFLDKQINSVVDLGSGTGSSIAAVHNLINSNTPIVCIEREQTMIDLAKEIHDCSNVTFIHQDASVQLPNINCDLLIASYFVNEIKEENLDKVLDGAWKISNQYLLFVDPGTPVSFKRMRYIRDFFIQKGGYIVSPCAHNKKCPISNDDWCCFQTRIMRSKIHKFLKDADSPFEDEKFTYLFVSKTPTNRAHARILRHPTLSNNKINLVLCNENGTIEEQEIIKSNKELFKKIKKKNCGDIFE